MIKHKICMYQKSRGLSLIPVVLISSALAIFSISSALQVSLNQKSAANHFYQSVVHQQSSTEIMAQAEWYAKPSKLSPITVEETPIAQQSSPSGAVVEGNIYRKPMVTNCPGTSFPCVNYEITSKLEQPSMIASETHVIGVQTIQVQN